MKLKHCIWLLILLCDFGISISQPLAPRNRTKRKPVLETFSGSRCNLCIYSDQNCKTLKNLNCGFTWINYHAGSFAIPKDSTSPDLRTPCGTSIHDSFRINAYPTAYIDRLLGPLYSSDWNKIYDPQFNDFATINIGVETIYDMNLNETKTDVELYRFDDYKDSFCFLSVLVIEDNVLAPQLQSNNQWINNYLHPNVFRDHITSCFGDRIDSLLIEVPLQRHFKYVIPKHINPKNAYIVAIITDKFGRVINSEVQPMTGGRTRVDAYIDDDTDEAFTLNVNDTFSRTIHFTSYQRDSVEYCFVISKDIPEWKPGITIENVTSFDTIRKKIAGGQTVEIRIHIEPISKATYGKVHFEIFPNCIRDSCYLKYFKDFTIHPTMPVLVIYNTSKNRDGNTNKVNLWKPITDVLENLTCDSFVVIKDQDFENVYLFRLENEIQTTAIYYAAGWGQSIFRDSTMRYLDRLMKSGTDLFIAGQDVAYLLGRSPRANPYEYIDWFENTLGAYYVRDGDTTYTEVKMDDRDPLFGAYGSSDILPVYQNGNVKNITPDVIKVDPLYSRRFLYNNKGTNLGYYRELENAKLVLMCIGLEMLENNFVDHIIRATHDWFDGCNVIVSTKHTDDDIQNESDINVKINNQTLYIEHPVWREKHRFVVFNPEGKILFNSKIPETDNVFEINLNNVRDGMYFYVVLNDKNQIRCKGKFILLP